MKTKLKLSHLMVCFSVVWSTAVSAHRPYIEMTSHIEILYLFSSLVKLCKYNSLHPFYSFCLFRKMFLALLFFLFLASLPLSVTGTKQG